MAVLSFVLNVAVRLASVVLPGRWFRFCMLLVCVWCWLGSFAFRVDFGRSAGATVSFHFLLVSAHRVGRRRPKRGKFAP